MAVSLKDLIAYAQRFLGVPYVYGGTTPKGFDCSGLVQYVYKHFGIDLPRTSQDQARAGSAVDVNHLSPGDLILSDWGEGPNSHVAIYAGNGKLIEAPRTGVPVRIADFNANYKAHANGYRRVATKKKGIIDAIEDVVTNPFGSIVDGAQAAGGSLLSWPGEIVSFFGDATNAVTSTAEFFAAFFRPSTYVRIGAGVLGSVFLLAGIAFLLWEAKEQ